MSAEGKIAGIFISHVSHEDPRQMGGASMLELKSARLIEGSGIESIEGVRDRYLDKNGAYSKVRPGVRQLTLISQDAIERANKIRDIPFTWMDTRRNIVISNISAEELNSLMNKFIALGGVELKGIELCAPCDRPDKLSGKKGFKKAFTNEKGESVGGLRVQIISSGEISINDLMVEKI